MYRAAVIGDRDSIYGFAALGLEVFPVTDSEMGSKTLRRLAEGEYAVIYITEALAAELEHELDHFRLQPLPAIIPIPGVTGNTGMGIIQTNLRTRLGLAIRATGNNPDTS